MKHAVIENEDEKSRTNAEHRDEATRRMMETAVRLIAEHGASKLSLVDVGRQAGFSHSLPNYYFKTKKNLLREVYSYIILSSKACFQDWMKRNMPEPIRPGLRHIQATVRAYLGIAWDENQTAPRAMSILWSEAICSMPELLEVVRPQNRETLSFFKSELELGIQRGEIDPSIDVEALALLLVSTLRGAIAQYMADPEHVNLDRLAQTLVQLLDRSIGLPPKSR